jgi:hypothetical protein
MYVEVLLHGSSAPFFRFIAKVPNVGTCDVLLPLSVCRYMKQLKMVILTLIASAFNVFDILIRWHMQCFAMV